jgi:hypothetical protein
MSNREIICLILSLVFSFEISAQQPCNPNDVAGTKGVWKKSSDANINESIPEYPQIKKRSDAVFALFQSAIPEPKGMEARWYRSMGGGPLVKNGPIPFQVNCLYLDYYCDQRDGNKLKVEDETGVWSYVFANGFNWFLYRLGNWVIDGKRITFFLMPQQKGEWKGFPLYVGEHRELCSAVIVTHENQLPYYPITQKQYLLAVLDSAEKKYMQDTLSYNKYEESLKKNLAEEEKTLISKDRDKILDALKKQLSDYQQKKDSYTKNAEADFIRRKKIIEDYLSNASETELQSPAVIGQTNAMGEFEGKFDTETNGGRILVRFNHDYYKKELPNYVPQFFIVYWRWSGDPKDLPSKNFKQQFESDFDIEKLKAMLDK